MFHFSFKEIKYVSLIYLLFTVVICFIYGWEKIFDRQLFWWYILDILTTWVKWLIVYAVLRGIYHFFKLIYITQKERKEQERHK